jgi:hypothetical protein
MQQQFVDEDGRGELVNVFADREYGGHQDVATLHDDVRDSIPKECLGEVFPRFLDIHQVTRKEQKAGHVKSVNNLLGIRVGVTNIDEMKDDHQDDEDALHDVNFVKSFPRGGLHGFTA